MIGSTFAFETKDSLVLFVAADLAPSAGEWKVYVDQLKERVDRHGKVRLLIVTGSSGPDALQRKQFTDAVSFKKIRAVVITDSVIARGIITAFRWSGVDLDAFKGSEIERAYQSLGVSPEELSWLRASLPALRASLDPSRGASR